MINSFHFLNNWKIYNKIVIIILLSTNFYRCLAQGGIWVWVNGSDTARAKSKSGLRGSPDVNNTPGGLWLSANWIDSSGNLWLYGGMYDSVAQNALIPMATSDLWRYEPANNMWTWMKGPGSPNVPAVYGNLRVSSPTNNPGANSFGYLCWTDQNNNLWLYGGSGPTYSNAMWRYSIANNEWTWMSGAKDNSCNEPVYSIMQQPSGTNNPGMRLENSAAWVDDQSNLWLFGGQGSGGYNAFYADMWRYNILSNEWTWMKGPAGPASHGNYGSLGIQSPTNYPPPRMGCSHWKDVDGNFYIGFGFSFVHDPHNPFIYNDIWKYNIFNNDWTWVYGDSLQNSIGNYSQFCTDTNNFPRSRFYAGSAQAQDCAENFYIFGGRTDYKRSAILNDLWLFKSKTYSWSWVGGSGGINNLGNYGNLGTASATNQMPGRFGDCQWVDAQGVLWIFGGIGVDTVQGGQYPCCQIQTKNDLWKFIPDTSCINMKPCSTNTSTPDVFIPNAFSPNGDGVNDRFTIFGKNIVSFEEKIFNRAGELLYETHDITLLNDTTRGWDGTFKGHLQEVGVYLYYITGKDALNNAFKKEGSVTLLK